MDERTRSEAGRAARALSLGVALGLVLLVLARRGARR